MYRIWQEAKCEGYNAYIQLKICVSKSILFCQARRPSHYITPLLYLDTVTLERGNKVWDSVFISSPFVFSSPYCVCPLECVTKDPLDSGVCSANKESTLSNTQKMMHSSHHYIEIPWEYIICIHNNTFVGNEQASHVENPNYRIRSYQRLLLYWIHRYWMYFSE